MRHGQWASLKSCKRYIENSIYHTHKISQYLGYAINGTTMKQNIPEPNETYHYSYKMDVDDENSNAQEHANILLKHHHEPIVLSDCDEPKPEPIILSDSDNEEAIMKDIKPILLIESDDEKPIIKDQKAPPQFIYSSDEEKEVEYIVKKKQENELMKKEENELMNVDINVEGNIEDKQDNVMDDKSNTRPAFAYEGYINQRIRETFRKMKQGESSDMDLDSDSSSSHHCSQNYSNHNSKIIFMNENSGNQHTFNF